jgi:hypothetical protein
MTTFYIDLDFRVLVTGMFITIEGNSQKYQFLFTSAFFASLGELQDRSLSH